MGTVKTQLDEWRSEDIIYENRSRQTQLDKTPIELGKKNIRLGISNQSKKKSTGPVAYIKEAAV